MYKQIFMSVLQFLSGNYIIQHNTILRIIKQEITAPKVIGKEFHFLRSCSSFLSFKSFLKFLFYYNEVWISMTKLPGRGLGLYENCSRCENNSLCVWNFFKSSVKVVELCGISFFFRLLLPPYCTTCTSFYTVVSRKHYIKVLIF